MKHLFIAIFLLFSALPRAEAQQVKGTLTDPEGDPVPYANVYVENTTYGTVSNLKGQYFLQLEDGEYRLVFQVMGFDKKVMPLTVKGSAQVLDVVLEPVGVEIEKVDIMEGRKDPAYEIIAQTIKAKEQYIRQFDAYKCNTYIKATLEADTLAKKHPPKPDSLKKDRGFHISFSKSKGKENDKKEDLSENEADSTAQADSTGKGEKRKLNFSLNGKEDDIKPRPRPRLNFVESWSETWFRYPGEFKSIISAYKDLSEKQKASSASVSFGDTDGLKSASASSGNPYLFHLDVSDAQFNFYENLIKVPRLGDRPWISPISVSARLYYKYRLVESFLEEGRVIHKIEVSPFNQDAPLFEGTIFIVDGIWAIKAVNFQSNPTALNFFTYFQVIHDYNLEKTGEWTLGREEYYYNARESRVRFYGNTIALHTNYDLKPEIPRNFFKNEVRVVQDGAYEKDTAFWNSLRPVMLKKEERAFIQLQDSLDAYYKSPDYYAKIDSNYNSVRFWDFILFGLGFRNRDKGREIYIDPLLGNVNPLGVGGYRHGLGGSYSKEFKNKQSIRVAGNIDYGFNNQDLKGTGRIYYTYLPKHFARFYLKGGDQYDRVGNFNSVTASLSQGSMVRKTFGGLGHRFEVLNGLFLNTEIEYADRSSLSDLDLANWANQIFGGNNTPADFEPYNDFVTDIYLEYRFKQKYITEPGKKIVIGTEYPILELHYKKGIPGVFGSSSNYDFLELNVHDEIKLGTFGESRWNVFAGRFLRSDSIQYTDAKFFGASDRVFYNMPLLNFQLLKYTQRTTGEYFQAHYIHHFNGSLLGRVPLLKKTRIEETCGASILLMAENNLIHTEVYAGLEWPFKIRKQLFKIGVYAIGAYSSDPSLIDGTTKLAGFDGTIKVGFNAFDPFSNKWYY